MVCQRLREVNVILHKHLKLQFRVLYSAVLVLMKKYGYATLLNQRKQPIRLALTSVKTQSEQWCFNRVKIKHHSFKQKNQPITMLVLWSTKVTLMPHEKITRT